MIQIYKNPALRALGEKHQLPVALSIAFYNNMRMLDLTLASVSRQNFRQFLTVICDDGSSPDVVARLHRLIDTLDLPVLHLWHEDKGFRKNRIMNWGIQLCQTDLMVFIDQDCLIHPEFINEHFTSRQPHSVLCGRRMDLTPWVSKNLTPEKVRAGFIEKNLWWILPTGLYMKDNNGSKGLHFQNPWLRQMANRKARGIVGCNFSVWRKDLIEINGFDFRYEGPGTGEDSDIEFRLKLNGVKMQAFCNTAVQYHVYHKLLVRPNANEQLFATIQKENQAVTRFGIKQQLAESSYALVPRL